MQGEWDDATVGPDVWETCRKMIPPDTVFAFLAEHRETLFPPTAFADMYPSPNGRPSMPPAVLAAVVLLQALEGASDREALQNLRFDLRWKAACGLGLHDTGFDASLLTYFRRRLAASADPRRIFTATSRVITETGVLTARRRRALDSAVLDDAVATQDTVTQIISAIRRVARHVPGAAQVVAENTAAHDYRDPGKPRIAWDDAQARAELVDALVTDAITVLARLPEQPLEPRAADAAGLLALVAGQDVEPAEGCDGSDGHWRIAARTAPDRVVSTVDPDARHVHKSRSRHQDGYKAHVAVEPETGLFTAVALRPGSGAAHHEARIACDLLGEQDEAGRLTVLGDSAYSTGELRGHLAQAGHRAVIKPPPLRPAVPGGFTLDDFAIDTAAGQVTCPAGHTVALGPAGGRYRQRKAEFGHRCGPCPLRPRCTTAAKGRILTIRPHHDLQARARRQAREDPVWQQEYRRWRPPVERSIAWVVDQGNRRLRYRGTVANDIWLHTRAAALNLRRLVNLGLTRTAQGWTLEEPTPRFSAAF
jgi:DDE family transposase/transposase-like protein DUF772